MILKKPFHHPATESSTSLQQAAQTPLFFLDSLKAVLFFPISNFFLKGIIREAKSGIGESSNFSLTDMVVAG